MSSITTVTVIGTAVLAAVTIPHRRRAATVPARLQPVPRVR